MEPNFEKNKDGLLPAIIQDNKTGKVLMQGYMNKEAFQITLSEKKVTFFSRSKKRLWTKGEDSGNFLHLKSVHLDCDKDSILLKVNPVGPVCHKGTDTCWSEKNEEKGFIYFLEKVITEKIESKEEGSYTAELVRRGVNKVAQKVGEEAVEVVIEATNGSIEKLKEESADLLYHLLVLLQSKNVSLYEVEEVLKQRHQ